MNAWNAGVEVELVENLYKRHAKLDIPDYYEEGEVNPFAGLCAAVPVTARFFSMVLMDSQERVELARKILAGLAARKKVQEVVRTRDEISYSRFGTAANVLILYV